MAIRGKNGLWPLAVSAVVVLALLWGEFAFAQNSSGNERENSIAKQLLEDWMARRAHSTYTPKYSTQEYYVCLLDDMPGTETDTEALIKIRYCEDEFPEKSEQKPEKKTHLFSTPSARSCFKDHSEDTNSENAIKLIRQACDMLYE
jgi:hypothetical protein